MEPWPRRCRNWAVSTSGGPSMATQTPAGPETSEPPPALPWRRRRKCRGSTAAATARLRKPAGRPRRARRPTTPTGRAPERGGREEAAKKPPVAVLALGVGRPARPGGGRLRSRPRHGLGRLGARASLIVAYLRPLMVVPRKAGGTCTTTITRPIVLVASIWPRTIKLRPRRGGPPQRPTRSRVHRGRSGPHSCPTMTFG
mmetsp:Transcript_34213/g.86533  ORF Transcript_34213/g.86533 Transcript_34213/m.86533 type:complete len:200 (+) Transcript_34213:37-636(+)